MVWKQSMQLLQKVALLSVIVIVAKPEMLQDKLQEGRVIRCNLLKTFLATPLQHTFKENCAL